MKLTRKGKLIRNVFVCVLLLFFFWLLLDQPLPLRWDYRRTEKAYFLAPKEILYENEGELVSWDRKTVYYFSNETIHRGMIENGVAWIVLPEWGRNLTFLVYDETGQAARAALRYTVSPNEEDVTLLYEDETIGEKGLFFLQAESQYEENELRSTEIMYKRDISEYLRGMRIYSTVKLEITLYDTQGNEVNKIEFEAATQ